jgi:hypothetical protein
VLLALGGCVATAVPYYRFHYDRESATRLAPRRLLVRPAILPPNLDVSTRLVDDEIVRHLKSHGFAVVDWSAAGAQTHWDAAFADRNLFDPRTGAYLSDEARQGYRAFLQGLQQAGVCDAVVEPSIVARTARLSGVVGVWDGNRERIRDWRGDEVTWNGTASALSLRILVSALDGTLLFRSHGGIDLVDEYVPRRGSAKPQRRADLLATEADVRHAVAVAFHPFIELESFPRRPLLYDDKLD